MLRLDGVRYQHGGDGPEAYDFNLSAGAGEIAGITGRSGAGKSTCLDLIAGFLSPTAGRIDLNGDNLLALAPEARPVTILFQRHNLFEHLSAAQNVGLGIRPSLRLRPEERARTREALERAGIAAQADQRAGRLSGGEQQRVALARSLARGRPILLLDEPFSALDWETRLEMLRLVREIVSAEQLICLMVTHDPADCERIADKRFRMADGRLSLEA